MRSRASAYHWPLILALAGLASAAQAAPAADAFYLGTWKIVSAVVAPWWDAPAHPPDAAETKSLIGRSVTIATGGIAGPHPLACADPKYRVKDYPPDWLFQGSFGEMHDRDKSVDPAKIAGKLGFHGATSKTLITGCANEIEYHFVDPMTAEIGLDNYVYTLKKQR